MPERRIENIIREDSATKGLREVEQAIDLDISHYSVVFTYTIGVAPTPDRLVVVTLERSYDNGLTWEKAGGFTTFDGDHFSGRFGQRMLWSTGSFRLNKRKGNANLLRVRVDTKADQNITVHLDYLDR